MNLRELLKSDTISAINKSGAKLKESEFKDYVASDDEVKEEIAKSKKSMALYRQQGNMPMVAKMETRIKQAEDKLKKK